MGMNKKCDIIIPIYNSPDWVELSVEAAIKSDLSNVINKIILVDDCSNKETKICIQKLKERFSCIDILTNEENLGFVKTCNKGMRVSEADFIMLLNSDCFLAEDTTKKLISHLEKNKKCGLICPISNNAANLSIEIPKGMNYVSYDKLLESKFQGKTFNACTIVGNCMVISRECYNNIGDLDEEYGMGYGEETDYQFKAQQRGYNSIVAIDTYVFHKSQMSFGDNNQLNERKKRNIKLFFTRWGYEYQERMKEYTNNDPIAYINDNLNKNEVEVLQYNSQYLSKDFIEKVNQIDRRYTKGERVIAPKEVRIKKNSKMRFINDKVKKVWKEEGTVTLFKKSLKYMLKKAGIIQEKYIHIPISTNQNKICNFKDLLFIVENNNEEDKERANNMIEQVGFYNMYGDILIVDRLCDEFIKYYRGFVFVNCEMTDKIMEFVNATKKFNKSVFYDCYNKNKDENHIDDYFNLFDGIIVANEKNMKILSKLHDDVYLNPDTLNEKIIKNFKEKQFKKINNEMITILCVCSKVISDSCINKLIELIESNDCIKIVILNNNNGKSVLSEEIIHNNIEEMAMMSYKEKEIYDNESNIMIFLDDENIEGKEVEKIIKNTVEKTITIGKKGSNIGKYIENISQECIYEQEDQLMDILKLIIDDDTVKKKILKKFNDYILRKYTTMSTGYNISQFFKGILKESIAFVLPSTNVCGGVNVVLKHCEILKRYGYDAFIINTGSNEESCFYDDNEILVVSSEKTNIVCSIDKVVATMWITNLYIDSYIKYSKRFYLVQGFETDFYDIGDTNNRMEANSTYMLENITYVTISEWCRNWLNEKFNKNPILIKNGIPRHKFEYKKRYYDKKITILVEGDPGSFYKNVDESFRITNKLNPKDFEVIFLSNSAQPKSWYRIDKFYHKLSYDEVVKVYRSADILIKSSILESFSYPPLEMMATGGITIAVQNDGNKEFMKDNINCLIYERGNVEQAIEKIQLVLKNKQLREKIIENGLKTAEERDWINLEKNIENAYK
jgi:GT2 family glycosyltransferase/glycosyltransferase involved in cell wall biosynthesis